MKKRCLSGLFWSAAEWVEVKHFSAVHGASREELSSRDIALRSIFYDLGKIPNRREPVSENTDHVSDSSIISIYNRKQNASASMAANETFGAIGAIALSAPLYFTHGTDWQRGMWILTGGSLIGVLKYMHSSYSSYKEKIKALNTEAQELLFPEEFPLK